MRHSYFLLYYYIVTGLLIGVISCNQSSRVKTTADVNLQVAGDPLAPPAPTDTGTLILEHNGAISHSGIADNENFLIKPGKQMGKINIGMQQEVMLQVLGKPSSTKAAMGDFVYTWLGKSQAQNSELNILTAETGYEQPQRTITLIRTTSPYFMTSNGTGVQKTLAEIKKHYPLVELVKTYSSLNHKASTDIYADNASGILFECLSNDQKLCVGVQVFPPGELKAIEF